MNLKKSNYQTAKQALLLISVVTLLIAGQTFLNATMKYNDGMNYFDFSLSAINSVPYSLTLIFVLVAALPFSLILFKENGISITGMIIDKKHLKGDIIAGLLGGLFSIVSSLVLMPIQNHFAALPVPEAKPEDLSTFLLKFISLAVVAGFLKELYFRAMAVHLLGKVMKIETALILCNVLFGIVDWYNMGGSFIDGFVWIALYKKRNYRLIVTIIAHATINVVGVIYLHFFTM